MQRIWIVLALAMLVGCNGGLKVKNQSPWMQFQRDYPDIAKVYRLQQTKLTQLQHECRPKDEPPTECQNLLALPGVDIKFILRACPLGPCEKKFHDCAAQGWQLGEGDLVRQCREEYESCKAGGNRNLRE